ncbi:hypothetical protein [uncultured Rikenella sp.]|uniref:hypothetical protein n=1 Tax=uncultured Rikenella sp. TaxID=368003 RepID=UPI0026061959|nr:hypothetical protein [uncultured Rikenella sp.]
MPLGINRKANPAPGFRDKSNGILVRVGGSGFCYSSSVSNNNGIYLDFFTTWLEPGIATGRGSGFQLRCLSE